ncbi:MAG: right-handed parallel beta-helix repeat-containing protein [Cocleimonas sp.]
MKTKIILLLVSFLLLQTPVIATNYFVSKSGEDTNLGTENAPFLTITKATDRVIAGDTVFIKAGTYDERVVLKSSGTQGNRILIRNYAQDVVIIDGTGITWWNWNGLFDISDNKSFITISGLRVINSTFAGFFIDNSHDISILNSSTYNTFSSGIGVWNSETVVIDHNNVELACNDGGEESISIANSSHTIVKNNEVHNNGAGTVGGEGIDVKDGSHDVDVFNNHVHHMNNRIGIYVDAWNHSTANINIYNNRVHDCKDTGIAVATEMGGPLSNVSIYNNIVYNNKYGGIEVGDWVDDPSVTVTPVEDIRIINNTLYNNGDGIIVKNADAKQIVVRNNILSKNIGSQLMVELTPLAEVLIEKNIIDGCRNNVFELCGSVSMQLDPLFVDPANKNFKLSSNSPAIDAGVATQAPLFDFESALRPINSLWDIGAYEFRSLETNIIPIIFLLLEDESL